MDMMMPIETHTAHITPADGNIFADLGFPSEEAAALLVESRKRIAEKLDAKASAAASAGVSQAASGAQS
jgi:hypothetical protein